MSANENGLHKRTWFNVKVTPRSQRVDSISKRKSVEQIGGMSLEWISFCSKAKTLSKHHYFSGDSRTIRKIIFRNKFSSQKLFVNLVCGMAYWPKYRKIIRAGISDQRRESESWMLVSRITPAFSNFSRNFSIQASDFRKYSGTSQ